MLIAAFIFVLSFAALIQFVVLQWRAGLDRVASASFAGESGTVSAQAYNSLKDKDFSDLAAFNKLCPDTGVVAPNLRSVRLYHGLLQFFAGLGAKEWAQSEMKLCSRYAVAVLMQQVQQNQALAAQVGSF